MGKKKTKQKKKHKNQKPMLRLTLLAHGQQLLKDSVFWGIIRLQLEVTNVYVYDVWNV